MRPGPFKLERYFAEREFSTPINLANSACEALSMQWLLEEADAETRTLWDNLRLGYTESQGLPALRAEVAALFEGVSEQEVLEVVPEEGILIAMHCLLQPGDHVICTYPGYQSLYEVAASLGCTVARWQPEEGTGWRFELRALEALLLPETRLVVANFPHNPTGYLPGREDIGRLVDLVRARGIALFSDEMYRGLEFAEEQRLPSLVDMYERALVLGGLSKAYGLPGLRVGWLVTHDETLLRACAAYKDYTTICASAPSELLALMALRARGKIIPMQCERIARNLALVESFFAEHEEHFTWHRPRAGSVTFPRLLGDEGSAAFCERVIRQAGVILLPATVYDYGDRHFRLGFGHEQVEEGLNRLGECLTG
jgi:aspartate/methionine/tyrosine aminotransferase